LGIRVITKYATKYVLAECIMRPPCLKDVAPKSNRVSSQIEIECDIAPIIATSRLSLLNRGYHRDIAPIITTTIQRSVKKISVKLLLLPDDDA